MTKRGKLTHRAAAYYGHLPTLGRRHLSVHNFLGCTDAPLVERLVTCGCYPEVMSGFARGDEVCAH